jgi:hypothetical protein
VKKGKITRYEYVGTDRLICPYQTHGAYLVRTRDGSQSIQWIPLDTDTATAEVLAACAEFKDCLTDALTAASKLRPSQDAEVCAVHQEAYAAYKAVLDKHPGVEFQVLWGKSPNDVADAAIAALTKKQNEVKKW